VDRAVGTSPVLEDERAEDSRVDEPWRVLLCNCDCHTFDFVEKVLVTVVKCSLSRARALSWEVHSKGAAVVYSGHRERCEALAESIGAAGLEVRVVR
jgi:ATP-dependent Clp protease adaptor protein ClpS